MGSLDRMPILVRVGGDPDRDAGWFRPLDVQA
jgi:hypothetical protein